MAPAAASPKTNGRPVVRVVILRKQDGALSENIQSQLDQLKTRGDCHVEVITEHADEKLTAAIIKQGNYDLVLIDKNVTSSPWHIIDFCSQSTSGTLHEKHNGLRFYIDGIAEEIVDKEVRRTQFNGADSNTKCNFD